MLINRLQDHALGKCKMTSSQITAVARILRKTLPDLKPVKIEYDAEPSYADAIRESYKPEYQPDDRKA